MESVPGYWTMRANEAWNDLIYCLPSRSAARRALCHSVGAFSWFWLIDFDRLRLDDKRMSKCEHKLRMSVHGD